MIHSVIKYVMLRFDTEHEPKQVWSFISLNKERLASEFTSKNIYIFKRIFDHYLFIIFYIEAVSCQYTCGSLPGNLSCYHRKEGVLFFLLVHEQLLPEDQVKTVSDLML